MIGLTPSAHFQPGSSVARPIEAPPSSTTSTCPWSKLRRTPESICWFSTLAICPPPIPRHPLDPVSGDARGRLEREHPGKPLFPPVLSSAEGVGHELGTRLQAELGEDGTHVVLDRARADEQSLGDLGVGQPHANQLQDLGLAAREVSPRPGSRRRPPAQV